MTTASLKTRPAWLVPDSKILISGSVEVWVRARDILQRSAEKEPVDECASDE